MKLVKFLNQKELEYLEQSLQLRVKDYQTTLKKKISTSYKIFKINGSDLVESCRVWKIYYKQTILQKIIKKVLNDVISKNSIDTITLSSTHLPFLKSLLEK